MSFNANECFHCNLWKKNEELNKWQQMTWSLFDILKKLKKIKCLDFFLLSLHSLFYSYLWCWLLCVPVAVSLNKKQRAENFMYKTGVLHICSINARARWFVFFPLFYFCSFFSQDFQPNYCAFYRIFKSLFIILNFALFFSLFVLFFWCFVLNLLIIITVNS